MSLKVTLNTCAHEVPSQTLKSINQYQGESRPLLSSTRNDDDMVKVMPSLSQTNFINDLIISKEKQREISAPRWVVLVDEEEQVSPPTLNSKLNAEAFVCVPKSAIAKKNEPKALASNI